MSHVAEDADGSNAARARALPRQGADETEWKRAALDLAFALDDSQPRVRGLFAQALAGEWAAFHQYWHHYTLACDVQGTVVREVFRQHATQEYSHARLLQQCIARLPDVGPGRDLHQVSTVWYPFQAGRALSDFLKADLAAEQLSISLYSELVDLCSG